MYVQLSILLQPWGLIRCKSTHDNTCKELFYIYQLWERKYGHIHPYVEVDSSEVVDLSSLEVDHDSIFQPKSKE